MKCPLCGKPVEDGAAFCPYCGMKLEPEAPGAQAAKEAPPAAQPERESAPAQPFAAQAGCAAENPAAGTAPGGQGPAPGGTTPPPGGMPPYSQPQGAPYYGQPQPGAAYGPYAPSAGVNPYYAREFALIASGAKAHFNFAAFFLGFFHTLYRGCGKRFLAMYAWPWVLSLVMSVIMMNMTIDSMTMAAAGIVPSGFIVVYIFTILISLLSLGLSLYNGFTFNRYYYNKCAGDARVPKKTGLLVGSIVLVIVVTMVVTAVSMVSMLGAIDKMIPNQTYNDFGGLDDDFVLDDGTSVGVLPEEGALEQHAGSVMYAALTDSSVPVEYSQILTESHIFEEDMPADLSAAGGVEQACRAAYLFYSDEYTLGQMLDVVVDDVDWADAEVEGDDTVNSTLRCLVDDTVIEIALSFFPLGDGNTCMSIMGAIVYRYGDMDVDSYYACTAQQVNSFMQWLCVQAGAETTMSAARLALGTWVSTDGQTLEITEYSMNGGEFYLNNVLTIEGVRSVEYMNDTGYGYLEPSADGQTMSVSFYSYDGAQQSITQYTRAA